MKNTIKNFFCNTIDLLVRPFYGTEILLAFQTLTDDIINAYNELEDRKSKKVFRTRRH